MIGPRLLMGIRLVLGALLLRQGAIGMSDLVRLAQSIELHNAWQSWPLIGSLRPMELALGVAAGEFTLGLFLIAGLLTRVAAFGAALISAFSLAAFSDLGLVANLAHAALLLASLLVLFKGGGAGTMDRVLGQMQQRSIERETAREAERRASPAGVRAEGESQPR